MNLLYRFVASATFFIATSALAQTGGTVTNHAFALGKGAGQTGYTSLLCGSAQLAVGQAAADPICRTLTGDVTIDAAGVTAIGTTKVTNAMLNADVFSTAHIWSALQTLTINQNAPTVWSVMNNSAGAAALASVSSDNGTGAAAFGLGGTGNTSFSSVLQNRAYLFASAATNGISIYADGADPINFYTNATLAGAFSSAGVFSLTTPLALTSGGVGASTQAGARTTLGLVIGTDVQAFDADLAALAANATDGFWAHTGAGTGAARTITAPAAGFTITNPAGIAGNPTFVLANDLAAIEGLASTGIARRTGTDAWSAGTAVSNAELATMAAYTIKSNATGSAAVPTDVSIPALTQKASPAANDKIMLADSAASDALKYATVSSLASAGSVSSIAGNTGAFTLSNGISNSTNDIRLAVPYFQANLSADATGIGNATFTKILNNTEASDSNGWYDNATNYRFTPLLAGRYRIHAQLQCNATTLTVCIAAVYKNGTLYTQGSSSATGSFAGASADLIMQFNGSTDYVEMYGYVDAASARVFTGTGAGSIRTWFEGQFVSP